MGTFWAKPFTHIIKRGYGALKLTDRELREGPDQSAHGARFLVPLSIGTAIASGCADLQTRSKKLQRLSSYRVLQCFLVCQRGAGGAACCCCWYTFESWPPSSPLVGIIIVHYPVKVWATASPCQPPLPLTAHSSSQQGAQPLPDRSWRAPCDRWASSASFASIPDALKQACRQGVGFNVKTPLIQPVLTRLSRAVDMC